MLDIAPAGDRAILIELGDVSIGELHGAAALARSLSTSGACVVGYSTLLVVFASGEESDAFVQRFRDAHVAMPATTLGPPRVVEVPVSFALEDAPDLPALLEHASLSRGEAIAQLQALHFRARFLGFRPGFAYLEGLPEHLQLPRRATSRVVPSGSFAIGGGMAGFYPADGPGGWNVIGKTALPLWDPRHAQPNLVAAGDVVRIVEAVSSQTLRGRSAGPPPPQQGELAASVLDAGQLSLIVAARYLSRYDHGLPPGGPFDPRAAEAANLAIGNVADAAVLECALVGPTLQFARECLVSIAGASAQVTMNGAAIASPLQIGARAGEVLRVGKITNGARVVVAISGGIIPPPASRYALAPPRLTNGEAIHVGKSGEQSRIRTTQNDERLIIDVVAGPHRLTREVLAALLGQPWAVTGAIDRTGLRLQPTVRQTHDVTAMPSAGILFGTVQHHPNGDLVVMGPDHPITGGYPQPFTVVSRDLWKLSQLRPGDEVRWRVTPAHL